MDKGVLNFDVKTGMKNIIGRDLITDDFIAIYELVKNSYDAYANRVKITFKKDEIIIADNGKGMSENDLKSVFESYYQGVVSEKVHNLGVGLGLNLCKELVELFNGEIKIESKINQGTKVSFNLILDKINK